MTATPEPGDEFGYSFVGDDVVSVHIGLRLGLFMHDPEQLERLGEVCLEAARDMRFAADAAKANKEATAA